MIADYRATFACMGKADKRARQIAGDANAFADAGGLQAFNAQSEREFDAQLAKEQAASQ